MVPDKIKSGIIKIAYEKFGFIRIYHKYCARLFHVKLIVTFSFAVHIVSRFFI